MTFIAGMKISNTVYLIADSAVTMTGSNLKRAFTAESAFGERHVEESNIQINTYGRKITRLNDNVIVAAAGDALLGDKIIQDLKISINYTNKPAKEFISEWIISYGSPSTIALIFAVKENGQTNLLAYNTNSSQTLNLESVEGIVCAGSTNEAYNLNATRLMMNLIDLGVPSDLFLSIFCSVLQGVSSRNYTLEHGFGGAFYGIYLNELRCEWLKQTLYITYSDNLNIGNMAFIQYMTIYDDILVKFRALADPNTSPFFEVNDPGGNFKHDLVPNYLHTYQFVSFINIGVPYVCVFGLHAINQLKKMGEFELTYKLPDLSFDLNLGGNITGQITRPNKLFPSGFEFVTEYIDPDTGKSLPV